MTACQPFLSPFEKRQKTAEPLVMDNKVVDPNWRELSIATLDSELFFSVPAFFSEVNGSYQFDPIHKTLNMVIDNNHYYMIFGVPVLRVNGMLLPDDSYEFKIIDNEPWLPIDFLTKALGLTANVKQGVVEFYWEPSTVFEEDSSESVAVLGNIDQIILLMKELHNPIKGAMVDTISSHLPGARRAYRNGFHEGMDWYGFSSGVPMNRQTAVYAMGNGFVVRADHDYFKYSSVEERNKDLKIAAEEESTPEYILDRLRGRQVWVQYENGLQARFSHLDRIAEEITVGDRVTPDMLIGYVGNTGTSGEVKNNDTELHLHLDLLYKGDLFWKGLTEEQIVLALKSAFAEQI